MDFIYKIFGSILGFFEQITGHYLLALLIFALLVKLIMLPFGIKQQKNSIKQAHVRPKEMAIRNSNKYKGRTDQPTQQKMQQEIMELYQQEGYNPASGCLPLLIQMPILLILYNVVISPLKHLCGYTAEMINTIAGYLVGNGVTGITVKDGVFSGRDIDLIKHIAQNLDGINGALAEANLEQIILEDLPNFSLFGDPTALAVNPTWLSWLVLIPILNFTFTMLSTFVSRKLTFQPMQNEQQGNMKFMNIFMAGMTAFIAFGVPAAIGIYWMFNNILGILQQFLLAKAMPLPKFTEEDFKAAEREFSGRAANKKETLQRTKAALSRPMEDDEYADLGDYHSVYDERPEPTEPAPTNESVVGKAPLKKKKK